MDKENNYILIENEKIYDFPTFGKKKVLVIGIGGGSDVVSAFGIASFLKEKNPDVEIRYGVSVSPKAYYGGFDKITDWLYQRKPNFNVEEIKELHHTLSLVLKMKEFDDNQLPFLVVRPKYKKELTVKEHQKQVAEVFRKTLDRINADIIYAVDGGGDSLTGGVSDNVETEFDRSGIRALQEYGKPFTYIIMGPGCDGESTIDMLKGAVKYENNNHSFIGLFDLSSIISKWEKLSLELLDNDRTPNIMRIANDEIKNEPNKANNMQTIQRHRKPKIPLKWLITGLAFEGLTFTGRYKR